jgi:DNA-binding PadR family transcriptional regulator
MSITAGGDHQNGERASLPGRARLRWQFTAPAVLLLLAEGPSHGYQLLSRLRPILPANAAPPDASAIYRLLRGLEEEGALRSSWADNPGAGPARRVYELTESGRSTLDGWAFAIASEIQAMSGLLATYCCTTNHTRVPEVNR